MNRQSLMQALTLPFVKIIRKSLMIKDCSITYKNMNFKLKTLNETAPSALEQPSGTLWC